MALEPVPRLTLVRNHKPNASRGARQCSLRVVTYPPASPPSHGRLLLQMFSPRWRRHSGAARLLPAAFVVALFLLVGQATIGAPVASPPTGLDPAIRAEDVRAQVRYLASEALEGRGSGTPGGR